MQLHKLFEVLITSANKTNKIYITIISEDLNISNLIVPYELSVKMQ